MSPLTRSRCSSPGPGASSRGSSRTHPSNPTGTPSCTTASLSAPSATTVKAPSSNPAWGTPSADYVPTPSRTTSSGYSGPSRRLPPMSTMGPSAPPSSSPTSSTPTSSTTASPTNRYGQTVSAAAEAAAPVLGLSVGEYGELLRGPADMQSGHSREHGSETERGLPCGAFCWYRGSPEAGQDGSRDDCPAGAGSAAASSSPPGMPTSDPATSSSSHSPLMSLPTGESGGAEDLGQERSTLEQQGRHLDGGPAFGGSRLADNPVYPACLPDSRREELRAGLVAGSRDGWRRQPSPELGGGLQGSLGASRGEDQGDLICPTHRAQLDEVGPGSWCVGLNATYSQDSLDWRLVWLNFTLSRDSQMGPSSFEYFDSYVVGKDGKKGLLELSFGTKEFQLASLLDDGMTRATSYYTNKTIVKPGDTVSIGIGVLQDTPNQLYLCDQDSNVLLSVPFKSSELQGQGPNYIVNRREGVFSSFMLDSRTFSVNQTLVDGYGTCSFDSSCGLETLTCTGQALRYPCPRSTPGLHWMISSKLVDTGLSGGIWGREFALSGLLGSYMLLGDVQVKFVVHFFQSRVVLLDPAHGLSCSGPYISNKPATRDEGVDWTIGLDSSGMVFLGLFDQTTQKHHTVCGFRNFGQDVHLVAIVPVGSRPGLSVFKQFGKGFPQGGHAPTSSSEDKYGFYHPVLNTTSQTYLPLVPYGQNAPFLPVGVPAIDNLGLSPPQGFFFNKTTSQYEPSGDSSTSGSLGPLTPFQLLEGTDSCDLEIYSLCNSTRVGLQAPMANLADGDWSLFAMVSTGIPTYPLASPPPEFNFQFSFKDEQGQVKFSIKVSNSSVIVSDQESRKIAEAVSPQCGPYCSTYPRGLFAFWLQKKSSSSTFTLGHPHSLEHHGHVGPADREGYHDHDLHQDPLAGPRGQERVSSGAGPALQGHQRPAGSSS
ncbi:hypothetical protein OJ253_707 [Cryptosporidium canis]|uniref:Uncharacterized protein n=1 Tax=Cryptosporidium canis TaxID=195482 RepID=A0A9D5DI84_9CRYT|nr:hypothetical protein OJ253_707 [Cryptosporidium canis]